jgi:hypothetical protein
MNPRIEEYLQQANPWWRGEGFDAFVGKARPRYVEPISKSFLLDEIKVLFGVRRSGKSTIVYQLIDKLLQESVPPANIIFINFENNIFSPLINEIGFLDDLVEYARSLTNPKGRVYLFLDEVQEVPGWERWANKVHEQKLPLHLLLTGSSSTLQSAELATLLTGRNLSFEIRPLDFSEYLFFKTGKFFEKKQLSQYGQEKSEVMHLFRSYLEEGGFPGVVLTEDRVLRESLLRQYFQDIIYRDLVRKYSIRQPVKLENLALYLISNVGRALSYRNIAGSMGIAVDTLKEYIGYFERACLFSFLSPFAFSVKHKLRETHNRKIYTADHGLRNVLAMNIDRDEGFTVENIVFNKLKGEKLLGYLEDPEVDFVFNRAREHHLVQVSVGSELPSREFDNLNRHDFKKARRLIVSGNIHEQKDDIEVLPAWYYLLNE